MNKRENLVNLKVSLYREDAEILEALSLYKEKGFPTRNAYIRSIFKNAVLKTAVPEETKMLDLMMQAFVRIEDKMIAEIVERLIEGVSDIAIKKDLEKEVEQTISEEVSNDIWSMSL